jgi:hypothetical protein
MLFADILIKRTAKVVCDIVLAVRERTCAAKAGHYGTGLAAYAGLYFFAVNGAAALLQRIARFKHSHFHIGAELGQFVCREYTARSCADNNYIKIHINTSFLIRILQTDYNTQRGCFSTQ